MAFQLITCLAFLRQHVNLSFPSYLSGNYPRGFETRKHFVVSSKGERRSQLESDCRRLWECNDSRRCCSLSRRSKFRSAKFILSSSRNPSKVSFLFPHRGLPFNTGIDMWSIGCILVEALTGTPLFGCRTKEKLLQKMVSILGPLPVTPFSEGQAYHDYFTEDHKLMIHMEESDRFLI